MEQEPGEASQHVENKTHRHQAAERLVQEKVEILEADHDIEFALAVLARAELIREFARPQLAPGRKNDVQQDLEPPAGHLSHGLFEQVAPDHKEPAHRVG